MSHQMKDIKQRIKEEYARCYKDPIYFMKKYLMVQHPTRGLVHFNLFPFQEDVQKQLIKNDYNIFLKSRQMGISTLTAGYAFWQMVFVPNTKILVIATKQAVAKNLVKIVRTMYDNIPSWLKPNAKEKNVLSIHLSNGSFIKATSASSDAGRSESLSMLIIDEGAFIDKIDEIWASAQQTIATGGKAIVISCVTKDTMVFTNDGLTEVSDFVDDSKTGGYYIDDYSVLGKDKFRIGNTFHNNGKVPTLKIKSKYSELEGSYNHKLFAYKDGVYDWYKLDELTTDSYISLQHSNKVYGNDDSVEFEYDFTKNMNYSKVDTINGDLSYLFGLYIAEGSSYKKIVDGKFVGGNIDFSIGDDVSHFIEKCGYKYTCYDNLHYRVSSKYLYTLFENVGFDMSKLAHEKEIPKKLLKMSRQNILSMISGMFDGDGCATIKKGKNLSITYTSNSEKLINQLRMLLLNEGILSCKYLKTKEYMNSFKSVKNEFKHDVYVLEINGIYAKLFYDIIGFRLDRKRLICESSDLDRFDSDYSKNIIPNSLNLIRDIFKKSDMGVNEFGRSVGFNLNGILNSSTNYKTNNLGINKVLKVYNKYKNLLDKSEIEYWNRVINENQVWVKVDSIEKSENYTYDFSLPDSEDYFAHSVLYNGIIGHQTPNGQGNWFHKMWVKASEKSYSSGEMKFNPIKLHWTQHPERDETWYKNQCSIIGDKRIIAQELDCSFISSGNNVVDPEILKWYQENYVKDPLERRGFDKNLWVWEYPQPEKNYIVVADVSRGDGTDYSACHVMDIDNMEQVAEYKGKIGTKEYGDFLITLATEYNDALLVIENASVGWATIQRVIDRDYKNLYYTYRNDGYVDPEIQLAKGYDLKDKQDMVPGFSTTSKTRPLIIDKLRQYMQEEIIIFHSERMINELFVFIWENNKPQAQRGYNDDLVMSGAISAWVRDTAIKLRSQGMNLTKKALTNIHKTGVNGNLSTNKNNPYNMKIGNDTEDVRWLF